MGLITFFKRMFDPEALGEQCISLQESVYRRAEKMLPNADPHDLLAAVWETRRARLHMDLSQEERELAAYSVTMQFACVPPPDNARALGLYFLTQERYDIYEQVPKFGAEYKRLMGPVLYGSDAECSALYFKLNPKMAGRGDRIARTNVATMLAPCWEHLNEVDNQTDGK